MSQRQTAQQRLVWKSLQQASQALSAEEISQKLSDRVNRSTVYRILDRFAQNGQVHTVHTDGGVAHFALCDNCEEHQHQHDHLHFQCRVCDQVTCLEESLEIPSLPGYEVQDSRLLLIGICRDCKD